MKHIVFITVLLFSLSVSAVPDRVPIQGKLSKLGGAPFDGSAAITVVLYQEAEAVTPLHKEVFPGTVVQNGVFSLVLGTELPLDTALFDENDALWVQIEVDGSPLAAPISLASVAYALKADTADLAHRSEGVRALAAAPVACNALTLGTMYLNSTDGYIHFCAANGWNLYMGPKGDPGVAGVNGEPGATGAKGDPGAKGAKGDPGATGATGAKGNPGAKGAKGDLGATGAKGTKGDLGATGVKGTKGDPGATGSPGANGGLCYTRWGVWGCASGFSEVMKGRPGGLEAYGNPMHGNTECVSSTATAFDTWINDYGNRLMRAQSDANGMVKVQTRCSICCSGGCYTALGTASCAAGYTKTYSGRVGGVEAYQGGAIYGKTLCIDSASTALFTWNSGHSTRLMRHRETSGQNENGMHSITNSCAVCCKQ